MSVKIIIEQFNIFDDKDLSGTVKSFDAIHGVPNFQIRFYVKSPYFSEDINGNKQFARKYRKKLSRFENTFCQRHQKYFNDPAYFGYKLEPLELLNTVVRDLENSLEKEFLIPGCIELNNIELTGVWEVYNNPNNINLSKEFKIEHGYDL